MPPTTAREYGERMRIQSILWPAPAIGRADLRQVGVSLHRIGKREITGCFVLERRGWGTVYCAPTYKDYRGAFDAVMPRTSLGRDVDHLLPKSRAMVEDFLAMGRISGTSNRGWNADDDPQAMAQKVRDMAKATPHGFTSRLTDLERGWAVVTCYIRPMGELSRAGLTRLTREEIAAAIDAP
ncbi:hypothetical protein [Jannaschia pohangensis]|uniref:Uncharacterized protein n=1 Tax=Jannaschia pohangensis TaxID=390807 RepID=A0A1I3SFU7_9RHOB|nr:hypothetical protein [Jannaschia pohangensis]SFJ56346.1 hypothetical protein SAMN04488095_3099 [Jannaschia pohangensis]